MDLGHWTAEEIPEGELPYGFIYVITNLVTNKKYIGKKQCLSIRKRPPLKGKKRKRHSVVETDWKKYTSSSEQVNKDIEVHGKDNFKFEIIKWCNGKAALSYYEAKEQFEKDALLNEDFYNGIINLRISKFDPNKKAINTNNEHS